MLRLKKKDKIQSVSYRPPEQICATCGMILKRRSVLWRKYIVMLTGPIHVTSWGYGCPDTDCTNAAQVYSSAEAEGLHLKKRQFGREVIIHIGYRRFWYHQTIYELQEWLAQDLGIQTSARQVLNLIGDFLALLRAGQKAKIATMLPKIKQLIVGIDGMQPEKGNRCLYIVRELQLGLTLLAENLDESSEQTIRRALFRPLKALAQTHDLTWYGIVSDAQETLQTAAAAELPGVPHQSCQSHCLRKAGELIFNTDRNMKKRLKASFRKKLKRLEKRLTSWSADDPFRPVLVDYADALHSTLLEGGVAPFELGGIRIFNDLTALAESLARCQKKRSCAPAPSHQNRRLSSAFYSRSCPSS